jgi:hypothetical protein
MKKKTKTCSRFKKSQKKGIKKLTRLAMKRKFTADYGVEPLPKR